MSRLTDWISKNQAAVVAFIGAFATMLHDIWPDFASALGSDADAVLIVVTFVAAGVAAFAKDADPKDG